MRYLIAALVAAFSFSAHAEDKFLHYRLNNNVVITISSIACPMKQYVKDFPYAAVASRSDGQKLVGCFNKMDENYLKIQWQPIGGKESDFTVFPANVFLPQVQPPKVEAEL
jgi:hypothetical protein